MVKWIAKRIKRITRLPAPDASCRVYSDGELRQMLANRALYVEQSACSKAGVVPRLPPGLHPSLRTAYARPGSWYEGFTREEVRP